MFIGEEEHLFYSTTGSGVDISAEAQDDVGSSEYGWADVWHWDMSYIKHFCSVL